MLLKTRAVLLGVAVLAASPAFAGQGSTSNTVDAIEVAPLAPGESWGGAAVTSVVVSAFDCDLFAQTNTWQPVGGSPNRFLTAGFFECQIHVPNGALITVIEVEACDTNAAGAVTALFARTDTPAGGGVAISSVTTGVAPVPGCDAIRAHPGDSRTGEQPDPEVLVRGEHR